MDWLLRHRGLVLAVTALGTVLLAHAATRLEFSTSPETILETSDEDLVRLRAHEAHFGSFEHRLLLVLRAPDVFAPEMLDRIAAATDRLAALPETDGVRTLARPGFPLPDRESDPTAFRRAVLTNRLLSPYLVSADGRTTGLFVGLRPEADTSRTRPEAIDAVVGAAEACGLAVHVSGVPAVRQAYADLIRGDLLVLPPLVILILAALLYAGFRRAAQVLSLLVSVALAGVWTLGILALTGGRVTALTSILPALLMVVGVAAGVHVVAAFREERERGAEPRIAARAAVLRMVLPCGLTSLTTAVGFFSLLVTGIRDVREFGIYSAVGALLAYVLGVPLLGVALSFGREPAGRSATFPFGRALRRLALGLRRRPFLGLAAGAALALVSLLGATRLQNQTFLLEDIRSGAPIHEATLLVDRELGGLVGFDLVVEAPGGPLEPRTLRWLGELEERVSSLPGVSSALGPGTLVAESTRFVGLPAGSVPGRVVLEQIRARGGEEVVRSLVAPEAGLARVIVRTGDLGSRRAVEIVDEVLVLARRTAPSGVTLRVGGLAVKAERLLGRLVTEMGKSLAIAFFTIFLLMSLLFGSLRVGALSMVPNFFPLLAAGGFMGFAGITVRSSVALVFAVGLGIAVDDTIHLLTRYVRERRAGRRSGRAVSLALRYTGRPVVLTSAILLAGFLAFLLSSFKATEQFGLIAAVTIATALVGDLLILPALLLLRPPGGRGVG